MSLEDAITHAEKIAKIEEQACFFISKEDGDYDNHKKCGEQHRQLAEWLKELKAYREQGNVVMDEIRGIIHSTIYDFMDESCDDEESPLTDKDELLLSVNKAICNNLKMYWDKQGGGSMNEQFEKKINESELREVKLDSGPLLQRKNAAWEIKEDLIRREEALEIIRTSDVWYAYTEKTPSDADIAFNFMKREIKDLPPVTPQQKMGRYCGAKMQETESEIQNGNSN